MKKNRLLFLILFAIIGCSVIFMGCNSEKVIVPDEYEAAGYQMVRLYYNGGMEGGNTEITYFVEKSGRLPMPDSALKSNIAVPSKSGYELEGWFEIKKDMLKEREEYLYDVYVENGETVKKEVINVKNEHAKKTVYYVSGHDFENTESVVPQTALTYNDLLAEEEAVKSGEFSGEAIFAKYDAWDFDFDRVEKDTCLVAIWKPQRYYVLVPEENVLDKFDEVGYNKLPLISINASGLIVKPNSTQLPEKKGYQVEGFYHDKFLTSSIKFEDNRWNPGEPVKVGDTEAYKVVPIYIKWLDEKYTIVTEASQISSITTNGDYYIKEHLDFTGVTLNTPEVYSGEILGNDKVWKNLTMTTEQINNPIGAKDVYGGVFKTLSGARMYNIIFENLSVEFVRISDDLVNVIWDRVVEVQLFAKSFDTRTELRNIVIDSSSTYTLVEPSAFGMFVNIPKLDGNGNVIRNNLNRYEAYANADGTWPEDDSYYFKNYLGRIVLARNEVTNDDGETLWGYQTTELPENALEPVFKEEVLNADSENIAFCASYMTKVTAEKNWTVEFGPNISAPRPLGDVRVNVSVYEFAGWYYEVEKTLETPGGAVTYIDFVKQDLTDDSVERTLRAMWIVAQ